MLNSSAVMALALDRGSICEPPASTVRAEIDALKDRVSDLRERADFYGPVAQGVLLEIGELLRDEASVSPAERADLVALAGRMNPPGAVTAH